MNDEQKRRADARKSFTARKHRPEIVFENQTHCVIDWRAEDGSSNYFVRYIIDNERGELHVTGDLGDSIASWYGRMSLKDLYGYLTSEIGYYISKLGAASDLYTYKYEDIKEDIDGIREYYRNEIAMEARNSKNISSGDSDIETDEEVSVRLEELEEDMDELLDLSCKYGESMAYNTEITDIIEKYDEDWYDGGLFCNIGRRVHPRVYLWAEGFRMACEMLGIV